MTPKRPEEPKQTPPTPRNKPPQPHRVLKHALKQNHPLVEITWEDAQAFALDWEDDPHQPTATTLSVGYLLQHTPTHTTIIAIINQNAWGHGLTIPNGCITNIRHLNPPT